MAPIPHQRIAQRYPIPTTSIVWRVARRRRRTDYKSLTLAEAALVEVSIMGAQIVCPDKWEPLLGGRTEVFWEDHSGFVVVRRASPFPNSGNLVLYGVEYAENPSSLGQAIYDRFIPEHIQRESRRARDSGSGRTLLR